MNRLPAFHVMAKPSGPGCNLNCTYCFYLEKAALYPGRSRWAMEPAVLESFIRQYIEAQSVPVVTFAWQGGEPTLLGIDYFRRVVELQAKHAGDKRIENAFQTNGVLVDDRWAEFLAEQRFLVGVSIDGPRELHDRFRVDRGGRPTFDRVVRGIECLKRHGAEFNTLTTVHAGNAHRPLDVYRFLKEIGSRFMQFIPVVERTLEGCTPEGLRLVPPRTALPARVCGWSVEPAAYGRFLCTIFDRWVRGDVERYFVQAFDVALAGWMGMPSLCVFERTCGAALAIEWNGDLYSCDHFVYPENRLGNIMEEPLVALVNSTKQRTFGLEKETSLPVDCRQCRFLSVCHGGCPKHRFEKAFLGEGGRNYLCAGYRAFFEHVEPHMQFMAEEVRAGRPARNIVKWAKRRG